MILRAGGRRLELGGRPLLMGILNATPDSFSDGREETVAGAARARAGAARRGRGHARRRRRVGARRPPGGVGGRGDRARGAADRRAGGEGALVSVDTYKPAVAEAAIAAGAAIVNDVSGLRDPALAEVCARGGAALVLMHTRVEPKGTLLDPATYDDVVADVVAFLRERMDGRASPRGWTTRR